MTNFENELAKILHYYSSDGPISESKAIDIAKKISSTLKDYAFIEEKEERDKIEAVAVVNVTFQTGETDFDHTIRTKIFKGSDSLVDIEKWYKDLNKQYIFYKGGIILDFQEHK